MATDPPDTRIEKFMQVAMKIEQLTAYMKKLGDPNYKQDQDENDGDLQFLQDDILSQMTNNEATALQTVLRAHDFSYASPSLSCLSSGPPFASLSGSLNRDLDWLHISSVESHALSLSLPSSVGLNTHNTTH